MRVRGCFVLACGLILLGTGTAAEPTPPVGEKLPVPRPVAETPPPIYFQNRSPADDTAELHATRDYETYIYVVNGADPFHWSGTDRLAARLRFSGYPHTKFGEWYDMAAFEAEYRKIRAENVSARVVLIGYDLGAYMVRAAANRLVRDGFPVAMVGYVGGEHLTDTDYTRPAGVGRVVNVAGKGLLAKPCTVHSAANVRIPVMAYSLPTRPETFDALYMGITGLSTSP